MSTATASDPLVDHQLSAAELTHYRAEGWVRLRSVIDPRALPALRDDVLAVVAARNMADSFLAQTHEYLRGSPVDGLVNSPRLARLAGELMAGPAHLYLPFTAVKGPHQDEFGFHQDNQYTEHRGPSCNCWVAIIDMTDADGTLRVVSHSHLGGTLPLVEKGGQGHRMYFEPSEEEWTAVEMRAGDCLVFNRLTVHGSGSNTSDHPRVAYAVQYHREDTQAYFDGEWRQMRDQPRWPEKLEPVEAFSRVGD